MYECKMNNSARNSRKNTAKPVPKKKGKQNNLKVNESKGNNKVNGTNKNISNDNDKKDVSEIPISKKATVVESTTTKKATVEPSIKKLERSNSFIERTLSKIYNKLSGSIENLAKIGTKDSCDIKPVQQQQQQQEEHPSSSSLPFKFQRSLTLNSFQLKKNYRKSILENSRLEKLSEEKISESEKVKTPSTPPKSPTPIRSRSPTTFRQSMPAGSYDNVDFLKPPPKLERSDSFISLIKRKISFNERPTQPATMNSNWAQSLQNLQQIDNMVSYEDLSFVNYDKFNRYEQQLDKMLNRLHLHRTQTTPNDMNNKAISQSHEDALNDSNSLPTVVLRRRMKKVSSVGDFNKNLDREKNVYRQSIDSNKLKLLSSINLDSHRWSQVLDDEHSDPIEWLSLENKSTIPEGNLNLISATNEAMISSLTSLQRQHNNNAVDTNSILSLDKIIVPRKIQSCENLLCYKSKKQPFEDLIMVSEKKINILLRFKR